MATALWRRAAISLGDPIYLCRADRAYWKYLGSWFGSQADYRHLGRSRRSHRCYRFVPALEHLGYVEFPINPTFQRRLFCKGSYNEGSHHLHLSVYGSAAWAEPILFRDYLRAHPTAAARYQQIKRALATKHQHDLNGYHDEKAGCVVALMEQARTWQANEK